MKVVERLRDGKGTTGEYVRHLKIGPFKDEGMFEVEISPVLEDNPKENQQPAGPYLENELRASTSHA